MTAIELFLVNFPLILFVLSVVKDTLYLWTMRS